MDIKRNSRRKPWIAKKAGRNRRNKETQKLIRPFTGTNDSTFYKSSTWRAVRESVLHRDPTCVWCLHLAKVTPATDADHVIPLNRCEQEGVSPYDPTNIVGSCRSCNSRRAAYDANGIYYKTIEDWVDFLRRKTIEKLNK